MQGIETLQIFIFVFQISFKKPHPWDFPGGPGLKNPPSSAGDVGLIPGCRTKTPQAPGQLRPRADTREACALQPRSRVLQLRSMQPNKSINFLMFFTCCLVFYPSLCSGIFLHRSHIKSETLHATLLCQSNKDFRKFSGPMPVRVRPTADLTNCELSCSLQPLRLDVLEEMMSRRKHS